MPHSEQGFKKPTRNGSQAGTFVGVPAGVHVHIVGGTNTHVAFGDVKKGGKRTQVDLDDKESITKAMNWLKYEQKYQEKPGYVNSFEYLRERAKTAKK